MSNEINSSIKDVANTSISTLGKIIESDNFNKNPTPVYTIFLILALILFAFVSLGINVYNNHMLDTRMERLTDSIHELAIELRVITLKINK